MKALRFCLLFFVFFMALNVPGSRAQDVMQASIIGTVLNDRGETLAGASLAAVHWPTGTRRETVADAQGRFTFTGLLTGGPYGLQVTHPGFRGQLVSHIFLKAGRPLTLTLPLVRDVVAVGTRRTDRSAATALAPVDVVDMRALALTAPRTDNTQLLNYAVPSFNSARETSADGSDHVDGASLRGLGSDQVLVLVNGKRRHTSALINLLGSQPVGSATTDLNTISANALDRVEVLRDGAAAQYGSDAIAGVMNFALKSDNHGGNVLVNNGIHQSGFGYNTTLSLNKGLKLGAKGFLNVTGEADYRGYTTSPGYTRDLASWPVYGRTRAQEDSFLLANRKTPLDYRQRNGDASMMNYRAVYNAGVSLSDAVRLYSFGTYNFRRGQSVAPWVLPKSNPDDLGTHSGYELGYQPNINTRIHDGAAVLGLDLKLGPWAVDLSQSLGTNSLRYDLSNTLNPSMGSLSPTVFDAGGLQFTQAVSSAAVSRLFDHVLAGTNVAFGGEFRNDYYNIVAGEEASWRDYQRGRAGASGGAQGFIGFDPSSAVGGHRQNAAGFLDVEADVVKRWTVGGAVRFENYSDFGSALIYKATTRVQASDWLAVRGAYNTGFRAPSQQQQLYRQLTLLPTTTGTTYSGIYNNESDIAQVAGIGRLTAERSRNTSAGLVLAPARGLTFTADAYQIDIDNRISLTNEFGAGVAPALDAALEQAETTSVQFFANALNTRTRGLDLVGRYTLALGSGRQASRAASNRGRSVTPLERHALRLAIVANFNETNLRSIQAPPLFADIQADGVVSNDFIGQRQLSLITTGSPKSKVLASVGYEGDKFGATLRYTRFGEVSAYDFNFDGLEEGSYYMVFSPKAVTDLILTYQPTSGLALALGAQNVFNVRPDNVMQAARNGRPPEGFASMEAYNAYFLQKYGRPSNVPSDYDILPYQAVQMGANGAFFYLKASYTLGQ